MEANQPSRLTLTSGIILGIMLGVPLGILAIKAVGTQKSFRAELFTEGYNFEQYRGQRLVETGLGYGEKIDLTMLRTPNGKTLKDEMSDRQRLAMLLVFDPQCGVCHVAKDQIRSVHDKVVSSGIAYYIVSFAPVSPAPEFHRASEALGLGAQSFRWVMDIPFKPQPVQSTIVPSHILVDQDGTVFRVWHGGGHDKPTRDRMAQQIVADTTVIVETLEALKRKRALGETSQAQ